MKHILLALFLITSTAHGALTKVNSGLVYESMTLKTSAYTATLADGIIFADATSGSFTISLPSATSVVGKRYIINKNDDTNNAVTIDPSGSETISGALTYSLNGRVWNSLEIVSYGSGWAIISAGQPKAKDCSFYVNTANTIQKNYDGCAASSTGTTVKTVTFVSGYWSSEPTCTCTVASGTISNCGVSVQSTSSFNFSTFVSGAATNVDVSVNCRGQ